MADDAEARSLLPARTPPPSSPPASPPPPPATVSADDTVMSLVEHLTELRRRILRVLLAVLAGSVVGFLVAEPVRDSVVRLLPSRQVQVLGPGDAFSITLRIAVVIGIVLAMPVILYQVWAFVAPGLTPGERRVARPWVPLALAFFALGCGIAWIVLPFALQFLLSFTNETVRGDQLAAVPFFDFVTTLFLVFGLVMEFPILLFGLSRVGIITSERLRAARRYVILGIAIFAAVVTPGGDLVSPLTLGGTMYVLYEATAFVIKRTGR
jgi:sec-independent protein translocase protein TatC